MTLEGGNADEESIRVNAAMILGSERRSRGMRNVVAEAVLMTNASLVARADCIRSLIPLDRGSRLFSA